MVFLLGLAFMLTLDTISRIMPGVPLLAELEPLLPVIGSFICAGAGVSFVRRVWTRREKAKAELGELAYQRMVLRGLKGVFLLLAGLVHSFVSVKSLPPEPPANEFTTVLSTSFLSMIGVPAAFDVGLRVVRGLFFLLLAAMTARRSRLTVGVDYMVVVYLYFPEESEIQNHEIYSVIRHPAYFSGVLAGIAAILARLSVYSILLSFVVILGLLVHIRLKEGELVKRFGDSYVAYMEKVPGLYVRPHDIRTFLRFVAGKTTLSSDVD
jgi:protein-S-isoprenylcysteine O-methyltransferase Ste14